MLLTPELRDRACKIAREEGASRTTIAAALGISSRTLQRWMDYGLDPDAKPEYREFRLLFNQARADHERKLVKKLEKMAEKGEFSPVKYMLEKMHGWGDSAVEERIVTKVLEYLAGKLDPELFQTILEDIEKGALKD